MRRPLTLIVAWLDRVDPGAHRRIKGLRLGTAYGIATAVGTLHDVSVSAPAGVSPGALAASFALWASVSEARTTRFTSSRDLLLLCLAAAAGAALFAVLAPLLHARLGADKEWVLVSGAFAVGYLKRYGILGAGMGSQIYIGQLTACTMGLGRTDIGAIVVAALIAMLASIVPRLLSGSAERPALMAAIAPVAEPGRGYSAELAMGLQAAAATMLIVALADLLGLIESVWAVTACIYVVAATAAGTLERVRRRIAGTLVGVPLALVCLPLATEAPLLLWCAAALAMIVYAMALPERYDIACGAFAFTLLVTLAAGGEHGLPVLLARLWETVLGSVIGGATAMLVLPLRPRFSR
ncbi:FUSC family protein [Achromobacter aloeverae]|uniref:LysR family transcriptional regulator n=1 Tax=Achromobacter aloeverae TaxID=1750518 RepID=A0A4Q1HKD4_9BURK|nr:FUSC family protein [Achromobacter aloeverae]RXN88096.1 LysR family transcriptional regulator [Achromobacter aloeverae]